MRKQFPRMRATVRVSARVAISEDVGDVSASDHCGFESISMVVFEMWERDNIDMVADVGRLLNSRVSSTQLIEAGILVTLWGNHSQV
jgi:hypothetical protein